MVYARLFHHTVCRMARLATSINRYMAVSNWAVPEFVIAFAVPDEVAVVLLQNRLN